MGANQNSSKELDICLKFESDAPLFQLGQDHVVIEKLLALGTGLGTGITAET
jgi:hypothetical protein